METTVLEPFSNKALEFESIVNQIESVTVIDKQTAETVSSLAKLIVDGAKVIEKLRDQAVRPLNEDVKRINATAKPIIEALQEIAKRKNNEVAVYQLAERKRIIDADNAKRKQIEALAAEAQANGQSIDFAVMPAIEVPEKLVGVRFDPFYEIIDYGLIPLDCFKPRELDDKVIKQKIKDGQIIPGLKTEMRPQAINRGFGGN